MPTCILREGGADGDEIMCHVNENLLHNDDAVYYYIDTLRAISVHVCGCFFLSAFLLPENLLQVALQVRYADAANGRCCKESLKLLLR